MLGNQEKEDGNSDRGRLKSKDREARDGRERLESQKRKARKPERQSYSAGIRCSASS